MSRKNLCLTILLPALMWGSVAQAQSTKERISSLEQQNARLERVLENSQQSLADTLTRMQQLEGENQELRNELETLQFESTRSVDRQRELYLDLDQRLQALEAGGAAGAGSAAAGGDTAAYQAAYDELLAGRYEPAGEKFQAFLEAYPDSELRDNAQYWLGETFYVRNDFTAALGAFQIVIRDYPRSRKIPDAWLKTGYCNYELEQYPAAREALTTLINQYPESTPAKLGKERLALMDKTGV